MSKEKLHIHIIEIKSGKHLARPIMHHCPSVGDELRLGEKKYFKVVLRIWVFDEEESPFTRINIGVEAIKG
jgi:hypothetical protein